MPDTIVKAPFCRSPYNMRGIAYYRQGQIEKAISDYNKAIKINPEFAAAYPNRGYVYHSERKYKKAHSDYEKVIELNPKQAIAKVAKVY
jgi:tetratricopeptide (TPR) repeat protein